VGAAKGKKKSTQSQSQTLKSKPSQPPKATQKQPLFRKADEGKTQTKLAGGNVIEILSDVEESDEEVFHGFKRGSKRKR